MVTSSKSHVLFGLVIVLGSLGTEPVGAEYIFGQPTNLGPPFNTSADDWGMSITADGLTAYFSSTRPGGYGSDDLWVVRRPAVEEPWGEPVNLGPAVNTSASEGYPSISADGLTLFFASWGRPGGSGSHDLHVVTRASAMDPWRPAVNLGPAVNSQSGDGCPCFWAGGSMLFFVSYRSGQVDFWQLPITPILDFSGDGRVDGREVQIMAELWGQDAPVADIAPAPFGNGIIDVQDLFVLAEYVGQEIHDATLAAHWALDETEGMTAADSAGDNDGILTGSPTWRPDAGHIGGALQTNGTTCVVADCVLNPQQGPFSVLAWIKGGAPGQVIVSQQMAANWLMAHQITGALVTELRSGGRHSTSLVSDAIITDDTWHRVAFTWDGSERRLYVDEVLVARDTDANLVGSGSGLSIGCGKDMALHSFFTGLIDDVRIYNRAVRP